MFYYKKSENWFSTFAASQFNSDRGSVHRSKFSIHQAFWGGLRAFSFACALKIIDRTGPSLSSPANSFCSASLQLKWCCSSVSLGTTKSRLSMFESDTSEFLMITISRASDEYAWSQRRLQCSIFQWKLCSFHLHPGGICCSSDLFRNPLDFFHTLNSQLHSCYPFGENEKVAV